MRSVSRGRKVWSRQGRRRPILPPNRLADECHLSHERSRAGVDEAMGRSRRDLDDATRGEVGQLPPDPDAHRSSDTAEDFDQPGVGVETTAFDSRSPTRRGSPDHPVAVGGCLGVASTSVASSGNLMTWPGSIIAQPVPGLKTMRTTTPRRRTMKTLPRRRNEPIGSVPATRSASAFSSWPCSRAPTVNANA